MAIIDWLDESNWWSSPHYDWLLLAFDIAYWIIPAGLIISAINHFVWRPLEKRSGRSVPRVVRSAVNVVIILLTLFGLIGFVFDRPVTSLLATSGLLVTIIGLAIQVDIANVFAGIALNLERPFRPGDWIKIGNLSEGKVIDMTWRATRLEDRSGYQFLVPNSQAAQSVVTNFSYPDENVWLGCDVQLSPDYQPDRVVKILTDAVLSVQGILEPRVSFAGLEDNLAIYNVWFYFQDYGRKAIYREMVWQEILIHLEQAGIHLTPQAEAISVRTPEAESERSKVSGKLALLQQVDIFQPFSEDAKAELAPKMQERTFAPGMTILKQGDQSDSLFIVAEGAVEVLVQFEDQTPISIERCGAGDIFGEMALLTGEPRTATIVAKTETRLYEITKTGIAPFIQAYPEVVDQLSEIITNYQMKLTLYWEQFGAQTQDQVTRRAQVIRKMQTFFNLSIGRNSQDHPGAETPHPSSPDAL